MQMVENLFEQALNIQLPWKVKCIDLVLSNFEWVRLTTPPMYVM